MSAIEIAQTTGRRVDPIELEPSKEAHGADARHGARYQRLLATAVASYLTMYVLMYATVDTFESVFGNLNQAYMAGLTAAPMVVIELVLMRAMYPRKRVNAAILAASVLVGALCWIGIREQIAIDDRQFLRAMIPHDAGAILMCQEARLRDVRVREMCEMMVPSLREDIAQMKALLASEGVD